MGGELHVEGDDRVAVPLSAKGIGGLHGAGGGAGEGALAGNEGASLGGAQGRKGKRWEESRGCRMRHGEMRWRGDTEQVDAEFVPTRCGLIRISQGHVFKTPGDWEGVQQGACHLSSR